MKALIAVAVVITSMPVLAAASDEPGAEAKQERKICRRVGVAASQTRLGRQRVCMTAAQWRARSDMSVDDAMDSLGPRTRGDRPLAQTPG